MVWDAVWAGVFDFVWCPTASVGAGRSDMSSSSATMMTMVVVTALVLACGAEMILKGATGGFDCR